MNNPEFSVHEVAELRNIHSEWDGHLCIVVGPLQKRWCYDMATGKNYWADRYEVLIDGTRYCCAPEKLRKRRERQDWIRLCALGKSHVAR